MESKPVHPSSIIESFNILELYSGIGGFHFALKRKLLGPSVPYCLTAIDINTMANKVYRLNHLDSPKMQKYVKLMERNIQSLSIHDLDVMNLNLLTMSPPCQPFSRLGNQRDLMDSRCDSFYYLMYLFPRLQNKPQFIILENVKGFETSQAHELLIKTLNECEYVYKEFILSPKQFMVPNSRRRYYLLAKYCPGNSNLQEAHSEILTQVPVFEDDTSPIGSIFDSNISLKYFEEIFLDTKSGKIDFSTHKPRPKIKNYLEKNVDNKLFSLNDNKLLRYHKIIDLVDPESTSTNCFTKSYGHRLEGCGSILKTSNQFTIEEVYEEIQQTKDSKTILQLLRKLELRFFTAREIANIMCFPEELQFPADFTLKQRYRLLGNSVNVLVCSYLLKILLSKEISKYSKFLEQST